MKYSVYGKARVLCPRDIHRPGIYIRCIFVIFTSVVNKSRRICRRNYVRSLPWFFFFFFGRLTFSFQQLSVTEYGARVVGMPEIVKTHTAECVHRLVNFQTANYEITRGNYTKTFHTKKKTIVADSYLFGNYRRIRQATRRLVSSNQ